MPVQDRFQQLEDHQPPHLGPAQHLTRGGPEAEPADENRTGASPELVQAQMGQRALGVVDEARHQQAAVQGDFPDGASAERKHGAPTQKEVA